jgi:hypothetical protein
MAEIIPNIPLQLDYTLEAGSSSPYPAFVAFQYYRLGEKVFSDPSDGGDGNNYVLMWYYYSSSTRPENSGAWLFLGTSEYEITSYNTDATISEFPSWSGGTSVVGGAIQYYDGRDYQANVDIGSGENTTNPAACLLNADEDIANRWADAGPSNAFRLLDDEVATATQHIGDWTVTMRGSGGADRVSLWSMTNIASVSIDVTAGEMLTDAYFISNSSEWSNSNASVSHTISSGSMTITNSAYASTSGSVFRQFRSLIPGRGATVLINVTCGSLDDWRVNVDGVIASSWQQGSGTLTYDWTTWKSHHNVYIELLQGTQDITVNSISIKDNAYTPQTISKTLEDATTGICRRNAVLAHNPVNAPQYVISFTAANELSTTYIGRVSAGKHIEVGPTRADVEVGGKSFSRTSEDQYGVSRRVRKRRARSFRAIVQCDSLTGDLIDQVLTELEGADAAFDFNNSGTDYARLQIYGWAEDWSTNVSGLAGLDVLSVQLRSLVETIRV